MYIKRKCTFGTKQHQVYRILGESSWTCHGQPSAALIGNRIGFPTSVHFPEETKPLDMILGRLKDTLQELDTRVKAYADEYKESMKYLSENKTGMDAMEIFSNQTSISRINTKIVYPPKISSSSPRIKCLPTISLTCCRNWGKSQLPRLASKILLQSS